MDLQKDATALGKRVASDLEKLGIDPEILKPDHLCFRVATKSEYDRLKSRLAQKNELLTEAQVNGRPISTFQLSTPLIFHGKEIHLLELPAPKETRSYPTGLEHVEYVIEEPFVAFKNRYPLIEDICQIGDSEFNPEMALAFYGYQVKFHCQSLDHVIELEAKDPVQQQMVVFDLDGTLIDSLPDIKAVNSSILQTIGVSPSKLDGEAHFPSTFEGIIDYFQIKNMTVAEFATAWGEKMIHLLSPLVDGTRELLAEIDQLGIPMTIWTARDSHSAKKRVSDLGIAKYFQRIWAFEDFPSKPNIEGLKFLTQGRPPNFVTFIGDTELDKSAAEKFGCRFRLAHEVFSAPSELIKQLKTVSAKEPSTHGKKEIS